MAGRAREDRAHRPDRARRGGAHRRRRGGGGLTAARAALACGAFLAACTAPAPPAPPPPDPPPLVESPLPASGRVAFEIGPITQQRTDDGRELLVESSVRNVGTRTSRDVKVWVNALDAQGLRIAEAETVPTPQEIAPGTAARFVVRLPNDPAIRTFHVEALGR